MILWDGQLLVMVVVVNLAVKWLVNGLTVRWSVATDDGDYSCGKFACYMSSW